MFKELGIDQSGFMLIKNVNVLKVIQIKIRYSQSHISPPVTSLDHFGVVSFVPQIYIAYYAILSTALIFCLSLASSEFKCASAWNYHLNKEQISSALFIQLQLDNAIDFANSWSLNPETCQGPGPEEPCEVGSPEYTLAQDLCYPLVNKNGPFRDCLDLVDPTPYHEACVYDLCATLPDDDVLCNSLAEYAQACREAGGSPGDWRSDTKCGKFH